MFYTGPAYCYQFFYIANSDEAGKQPAPHHQKNRSSKDAVLSLASFHHRLRNTAVTEMPRGTNRFLGTNNDRNFAGKRAVK